MDKIMDLASCIYVHTLRVADSIIIIFVNIYKCVYLSCLTNEKRTRRDEESEGLNDLRGPPQKIRHPHIEEDSVSTRDGTSIRGFLSPEGKGNLPSFSPRSDQNSKPSKSFLVDLSTVGMITVPNNLTTLQNRFLGQIHTHLADASLVNDTRLNPT